MKRLFDLAGPSARPGKELDDREGLEKILGNEHKPSDIMGILLEPAEQPWCTNWHRDWGHHVPGLDMEIFYDAARHHGMFNQLNGALYNDASLWVVPGSHDRVDTEQERAAFSRVPPPGPELPEGGSPEARELACRKYARRMPGAVEVVLGAGDVAFYRASG